jgi:hypothetical protein
MGTMCAMDTTKEAYKAKMEAQLADWSARLAVFKARTDKAAADARIGLAKQAEELKTFEATARKHIAEVEASASDGWNTVKGGIEQTWNQLSGSVEALWAKISPDPTGKN